MPRVKLVVDAPITEVVRVVDLVKAESPALVRLEVDSITGNPEPGVTARIADPAWMLGRQWQFGELIGEDAGDIASIAVESTALPVTAWAPLGATGTPSDAEVWRPWHEGAVLEELIQAVPGFRRGVRQRAEIGAQLLDMLDDAGESALAAQLAARYRLSSDPDPTADRLLGLLGGTVPDGAAILEDSRQGEPAWLSEARDHDMARAILREWVEWAGDGTESGQSWSLGHLEYRFALRFGDGPDSIIAVGTQYGSATVRWSDLELWDGPVPPLPEGAGAAVDSSATMYATPLSYPGMPADRYWELEDGSIDLGAIKAQPYDLARLCLAEFAMTSGDDWLLAPLDGLLGAVNRVTKVTLTDDYGESITVPELRADGFSLYQVSNQARATMPGVLLPPVSAGVHTGQALEEVFFLRDEMANMAWAIEMTVQGPGGDPRSRLDEEPHPPDPWPEDLAGDELVYRLQTPIPEHWIPLVPVALRHGSISLRKGAMIRSVINADGTRGEGDGEIIEPLGRTLRPTPLTFPGEEIPREGVAVRAVPMLARHADGRYVTWCGYRVGTASGEAASHLAWDAALSPKDAR